MADRKYIVYRQYIAHFCGCVEGFEQWKSIEAGGWGHMWSPEQILTMGLRSSEQRPQKKMQKQQIRFENHPWQNKADRIYGECFKLKALQNARGLRFMRFAARRGRKPRELGRRGGHSSFPAPLAPHPGCKHHPNAKQMGKHQRFPADHRALKSRRGNLCWKGRYSCDSFISVPWGGQRAHPDPPSPQTTSASSLSFPRLNTVVFLHGKRICSQKTPNKWFSNTRS